MKRYFPLLFLILTIACSEDNEVVKESVNLPLTVQFKTDGIMYRGNPLDSFVFNSTGKVSEYYRFRKNGNVNRFSYQETASTVRVMKDFDEDPEYIINPPAGNSWTIDLTGYERRTSTPGMIRYSREGNVYVITRWEYPSLEEEDFDIEVDGEIVKRTVVTLNESGNVSKVEVFHDDFVSGSLLPIMTLRDIEYDDKENPLQGLRKEYEFSESGYYFNHEFLEFYSNNNVISYSADYHDNETGSVDGTNNYSFSYVFDKQGRVVSSKISAGLGEYVDDIVGIKYR